VGTKTAYRRALTGICGNLHAVFAVI